jgi:hypothetical protein
MMQSPDVTTSGEDEIVDIRNQATPSEDELRRIGV